MRLSKRQLKRIIREEYTRLKRRGLIKESAVWQFNPEMGEDGQDCEEGTPIEECADTWVEYVLQTYSFRVIESIADFVRPGRGQDLIDYIDYNSPHDYVVEASEAIGECLEGMDIRGSGNWDRMAAADALANAFLAEYSKTANRAYNR